MMRARIMARVAGSLRFVLASTITLGVYGTLVSCERKPRAREREAAEERVKAAARDEEAARRAAEPPPAEPPVDVLRVPGSGLPCKVDDAFALKCRRCHTVPTRHGAPFVFLTWADTQQERGGLRLTELIGRAVRSGFMPYRIEANPPVQPLTDEEKRVILQWVDAGGPRQDCDPNDPDGTKAAEPGRGSAGTGAAKKPAATARKPVPAPSASAPR
jgi:hypothetical protein